MSSCVAELDAILQSMLTLKPPGVTASKINSITTLCNANIQSESVLIQKVYTHFKKAPGTHKLGVLYVVDSVTRSWVEQSRKAGQASGPAAPDGTAAAGINHVTELLPSLMTDIANNAPENQKEKIKKLLEIWERGSTFPADMLAKFKEKLTVPTTNAMQTTTPQGTPPAQDISQNEKPANASGATAQDTSAILQALADMAKSTNNGTSGMPPQDSSENVTNSQNAVPQTVSPVNQAPVPSNVQVVGAPGAVNGVASFAGPSSNALNLAPNPPTGLSNMPALPMILPGNNGSVTPESLQQQLQILQVLQAQGVPQDQWATVLSVLMSSGATLPPNAIPAPPPNWSQNGGLGHGVASRDHNGYNDQDMRSPINRFRKRSRSPSPPGWGRRRESSPPRRRDSPVYGEYSGDRNGRGNHQGNGRGRGNNYRQRSPLPNRMRRTPSPRHDMPPPGPKYMEFDRSLGSDKIKVLSRTLFVGGVTSSDDDLRATFTTFGRVQTCIVNVDKRHAFVKMVTRAEAVSAKEGMEHYRSTDMQLRTRWGVGFGPRDCSDYQTGISIIPIDRLTDADRKWMLTAEFGGTGGKPIEGGLVVEEPDIEIGAGVSSKAISRRMASDKGGFAGPPPRSLPQFSQVNAPRFRQPEPRIDNNIGVAPPVPGFGFQFPPMQNGMQMFPPGFVMPGGPLPPGSG